jgi:phage shock protein PspC (stress-responsive transcriptional regulator)
MSTTDTPTAPVKELHRSADDRYLAGVSGGLGAYFDISPTFFRVGFAILTLVGGAGILLYAAAALVIPAEGSSESIASEALRRRRDRPWLLAGVALIAIAVVSLFAQADFWPNSGFAWLLLLLGGIAIVASQRQPSRVVTETTDPATGETTVVAAAKTPRRPSFFAPAMGLLLAAAGVLALLSASGVDVRWDLALGIGAVATGVLVVAGAVLERRTGGLVVVGLTLAALAVAVSAIDVRLEGPIGERTYRPAEAGDVRSTYEMSIGDFELDLSDTALASGETEIEANLGIGDLLIVVPRDAAVDIDASASAGLVSVFGEESDGFDVERSVTEDGDGDTLLRIDAHVGLGDVRVVRDR